ncbi:MAG: aldo/keto reductase [Candidatus Humimicrobiaceae bacterium]
MNIETKKLKNGFELPLLGFGTWGMGGRDIFDPENDDKADIKAIKTAIELGMTHIDTAEFYAEGHAEELVAQAIKGLDRSRLIITTKVTPMHLHYKDLVSSAQQSLKRLKTDYIDVYLIHSPNPYINIKESMEALDFLLEKKIIRFIGLSNFDADSFSKAQSCTHNKIICNHLHYNLKHRGPLNDGTIKYSQDNDIMVVAWRPLQKGLFSKEETKIVRDISIKYEKTANQVAINWLISQKNVVTISKSRNTKHLNENLGALGWKMEYSDINFLTSRFPDTVDTVENTTLTKLIRPE